MNVDRTGIAPIQARQRDLERTLIEEFVRAVGHDPQRIADLGDDEREALLAEASVYASMKLAEIDSRSQFIAEIHGGGLSVPRTHATEPRAESNAVPFRKRTAE